MADGESSWYRGARLPEAARSQALSVAAASPVTWTRTSGALGCSWAVTVEVRTTAVSCCYVWAVG